MVQVVHQTSLSYLMHIWMEMLEACFQAILKSQIDFK